ncbi:unnamed protein product [Heligmosomoides polygyrus]|uniref:Neur_chan_LBD domain-containing protein n=1 Tax=Heligmosomoides polygyrus TaxID=6339 RepID=A0A183GQ30_HELPZ|nr:unnamed protein product [Heligmosomoides polygyrus]
MAIRPRSDQTTPLGPRLRHLSLEVAQDRWGPAEFELPLEFRRTETTFTGTLLRRRAPQKQMPVSLRDVAVLGLCS